MHAGVHGMLDDGWVGGKGHGACGSRVNAVLALWVAVMLRLGEGMGGADALV